MVRSIMHKRFFIWLLLTHIFGTHASKILIGNNGIDQTFTFPVLAHAFEPVESQFFVGANKAIENNNFAVARATQFKGAFEPLAPATIILNGKPESINPLHGQRILHMSLLPFGLPVVVTEERQSDVVFLTIPHTEGSRAAAMSATNISDATGATTDGIVGISSGSFVDGALYYVFAAVKKNGGNFGDKGGGVALIRYNTTYNNVEEKKEVPAQFLALDTTIGDTNEKKALALDVTTSALKINNNLAAISPNIVDMHYDSYLKRLYIALHVQASNQTNSGARALVVGRTVHDALIFSPMASDELFSELDMIIGKKEPGVTIAIDKVRTLQTSSRLSYVVVAGGVKNKSAGHNNCVYALPVVDKNPIDPTDAIHDSQHGTLAKFDAIPVDKYAADYPYPLRARGLIAAAAAPSDLLTSSHRQALVGGGPLPLSSSHTITDIVALDDTVYVSIGNSFDTHTKPGIYVSQALLDELGRIKSWTAWQRTAGTDQQIFGFAIDVGMRNTSVPNTWMITGTDTTTTNTIQVTVWSQGDGNGLLGGPKNDPVVGLVRQLETEFPTTEGGIHNLFIFPHTTPSFGKLPEVAHNQLSLFAVVGLHKLVLAEMGRNNKPHQFKANTGDYGTNKQTFTDGTLHGFIPGISKIISLTGGVLSDIGPLTAVEISRLPLQQETDHGYLFVGGARGLAVLSTPRGEGWNTELNNGLHAGFVGLTPTMSFKTIGAYKHVRKLISDDTFLYVLTNNRFDRIRISSLVTDHLEVVTLATPETLGLNTYGSFSDVGVSEKFGLLATSGGMFRIGNGKDIRQEINQSSELGWTRVAIPESTGPVSRFFFISPAPFDNEIGFARNGMVYVLSSSVTLNQARVNRFFVADVTSGEITDKTIQPLNDLFIRNNHSFLIEFGSYRNFIATDGLFLFNTRSGNQQQGSSFQTNAALHIADRFAATNKNISVAPLPAKSSIRYLIRNSASGSWLVAGNLGLFVNE